MPDVDSCPLPRLRRVEALHVRVPFRRPLLDATGEYTHRRSWLLRLVDADGREGLGEAALGPFADEVATGALARLIRELAPGLLEGRIPAAAELLAEGAPGRALMAGIEGALGALAWVATSGGGSAAGPAGRAPSGSPAPSSGPAAPGSSNSIPVCAVIGFGGPDAGADAGAQAIELGFETLKIRAGFERTTDQLVDRLRALRAAVGPEPRIRVDAGGAWTLDVATERLAAVERFRIEFVEQPLDAAELTGSAALSERVAVPVALDEAIDSEGAARAALMENAADVLVVKPARVGGAAAVRRVADAAAASGVGVVLASHFETGVGIAATLRIAAGLPRNGRAAGMAHGVATAGVLAHDLLTAPLPIEKGRMAVPPTIALDEDEVARYTIERFEVAG